MFLRLWRKGTGMFLCGLAIFSHLTSPAQDADQTGVTVFRMLTTNLFGSGVRICQAEAVDTGEEDFEVNPTNVGAPNNVFTYYSSLGSSSLYPNSVGSNAYHPERVAEFLYGTVSPGPAPAGIATNVAHVDVIDANYFGTAKIEQPAPVNMNDAIVNQSYAYFSLTVAQQQELDSFFDNYSAVSGALLIGSVGAGGSPTSPGTAYDCIAVAAYDTNGANSSIGPTVDNGRCKPDITAPDGNTSFAIPQVSGAAAVLIQAGGRGDGGSFTNGSTNMLTLKALLLNGAVKPLGWTNGTKTPLDARYGAGMLNLYNSYRELTGGRHTNNVNTTVTAGGAHPPNAALTNTASALSGWDFNTNTSSAVNDSINHYYFNVTNGSANATFLSAATLVWNRHNNPAYYGTGTSIGINNLRLYLYNAANSNLVTCSTSAVDNVQHLYLPQLAPGRYDLQVWKAGGSYVTAAEPYALAFTFVTSPALRQTRAGTNVILAWPAYPAGYSVQAANGLSPVATGWSTLTLPAPAATNLTNYVTLNPTNKVQFFRLTSPNF